MEALKTIFLKFNRKENDDLKLEKIVGNSGRFELLSENVYLNLNILGFKISLTYDIKVNNFQFNFKDAVGRVEDLDHLIFIYARLLNQRSLGVILDEEEIVSGINYILKNDSAKLRYLLDRRIKKEEIYSAVYETKEEIIKSKVLIASQDFHLISFYQFPI